MGKTELDRTGAETLEPILVNPNTVNVYKDNTTLLQNELEVANNVIFDDGVIEKSLGTLLANSDTPGDVVTGLHRSYGPSTEKVTLRLANGTLKSGDPTFGTTVLSSLSTSKITPFVNIKGKAWGINETNGLIRYDPKTGQGLLTGITGPFLRKKIAFFEDDETWSAGTADYGAYRIEEFSGKSIRGLKVAVAAASGNTATYSDLTLDLSVFSNSKASDDTDFINFWTKHSTWRNINYITLEFSTGDATYAVKFMATLYQRDFELRDYSWTHWKVKKGAFIKTGAADWATVKSVRLTVYSNSYGGTDVTFDYMMLTAAPIESTQLLKRIFDCEGNVEETWSDNAVLSHAQAYKNFRSVYVLGTAAAKTATLTLTTALDLSKWVNGVSTQDSDEFVFYIRSNDVAGITDASCLTLRVGQDSSNYYYYTWATKAALGIAGNNYWIEVRLKKGDLDALSVGTPNFTAVDYVAFVTSSLTNGTYVYFDYLTLQPYATPKEICDFEDTETWTFTGGAETSTSQLAKWVWTYEGVIKGTKCLRLYPQGKVLSTATYDCSTIDLTQWTDGSASNTDDYIAFYLYAVYPLACFDYLEIWFDNNSLATFANAYYYRLNKTDLDLNVNTVVTSIHPDAVNSKMLVRIPKSSFSKVGTSGAWSTIGAIKFIAKTYAAALWNPSVFIDYVHMARKGREQGRYYYKYCFVMKDICSALSDESEQIDTDYNSVLLSNIKTSQDSRVTGRRIFRLGGTYSSTWFEVATIEDNTTTYFVDDKNDDELLLTMGEEVPKGNIDVVKGNNLAYDPTTDRLLTWGDPNYETYIRYSPPGYYYAMGEASYREMPDKVMSVVPWYGQKIVFYKNRAQKISFDVSDGELVDLPFNVGTCSYNGVKCSKDMIFFAGWDNVYATDGYKVIPIGDEIKNYFKGRETYLSSVNVAFCKDTLYIACKAKTGSPTTNTVVLRYYIPTKSWSVFPNWAVNVWSNWDQGTDLNDLYYGSSADGNIFKVNYTTYQFNAGAITSTLETGWMNIPDHELAIHAIELKAKGTAASTLSFAGYKNLSGTSACTGSITLTTSWVTYTIGPKNIHNILRGDHLKLVLSHATDSAYFKIKDLVVRAEKIPKRITLNEVTVTLT